MRFRTVCIAHTTGAAARRRWRSLRNTGIAVRLSAAFAVVALLAITANLMVLRVSTVKTQTIERLPTELPASPRIAPVPERPVQTESGILPNRWPPPGPLLAALGDYTSAIDKRAEASTPEAETRLRRAAESLRNEAQRFITVTSDDSRPGQLLARLSSDISSAQRAADEFVKASDDRRAHFSEYWDRLEALDAQVKGSLDRNWKIFGRVIARESLLSLSRNLDDVRRDSARLSASGGLTEDLLHALSMSQQRLATALSVRNLERAQGTQWLQGVRQDFERMLAAQAALIAADRMATDAAQHVEREVAQSETLLRLLARPAVAQAEVPQPFVVTLGRLVPTQATQLLEAHGATQVTTTTTSSDQAKQRLTIGLVSVLVLALLLFICVSTVRSIVRPIRYLVAATTRLSSGDVAARVERGGIREIDLLAAAFNDMAARLATAHIQMHEYQAQLEKRVEERTRQLQHLAEHDPLTSLPNRRQLLTYLDAALRTADREGTRVGVFFLDLDNFKNINDSMGHAFGDRVLTAIADRLLSATCASGFAARLGGDEFTVLCEGAASIEDICSMGGKLVRAFQEPVLVDGREILIGVSVGASVYPDHERTGEALLSAADAALFQAKTSGRSQLSLFSPAMLESAALKFRIEQGLRRAVDRGELELLFQPEVSFGSMGTQLVEALLRWRLPDGRQVSPGEFLEVAEDSGLIMSISEWVLSSAIECAAEWHRGPWPEVRMAINVSARQLLDARFVDRLADLLRRHRLPPACIEIELTETVLQTGPATIDTLRRLRELGVAIALDDFGTGYSSLASLELLPLTRVKLDRSLIASIHTSARSLAIARAIVGLCRSLGLAVTAEGIERPEQLAVLLEFPGLYLQGYLFAKPVSLARLPALIAEMPNRLETLLLSVPAGANDAPKEEIGGSGERVLAEARSS